MADTKVNQFEKARELLGAFHNGMLVTRAANGELHAFPMAIAELGQDASVTFVTGIESTKVDEILRYPNVGLTLQSSGAFVAVSGEAQVIIDATEKERVWGTLTDAWFNGPEDPQAALIRVRPRNIEYWDQRGMNSVKLAFEIAKAKVTGESPHTDERQHGAVHL